MLTPYNFDCHEAVDGQNCIEQALNLKPDLILMDSRMPIMDGLETCQRIRSSDKIKEIKIIAISANAYEQHRQQCLDAGANDFLGKPIQLQQLLLTIARHTELVTVYETHKTEPLHDTNKLDKTIEYSYPSKNDLKQLLSSAEQGDIQDVRNQINVLKQSDNHLVFLEQLNSLANDFKINKICQLLIKAIKKQDEES